MGCVLVDPAVKAARIADHGTLVRENRHTEYFQLASWRRIGSSDQPLHVYIEGDGNAFSATGRPTKNPTPLNPLALSLASLDSHPNVVYLARPYQYLPVSRFLPESQKYWTTHRYSEKVVRATNAALSEIALEAKIKEVKVIGFSGGGTIAALLAARRNDITLLATVAGYLDTSGNHDLTGSLNPTDFADALKDINQIHFIGTKDVAVPPQIARSYQQKTGVAKECFIFLDDTYHHRGWKKHWPQLLLEYIINDSDRSACSDCVKTK